MTPLLSLMALVLASPQTPVPASLTHAGPAVERFVLDSEKSRVGFDGTSTLHDFEGLCETVHGELRADPARPEASGHATFWIDPKQLSTDNSARDSTMYDALETDTFGRIEFTIESITRDDAGQRFCEGHFIIHGISRARRFPIELEALPSGGWHTKGGVTFNVSDHGITPPSMVVVSMHDEVRIWFDLTLLPAPLPRVEARHYTVQIQRTTEAPGAPERTDDLTAAVWTAQAAALFETPDAWQLATQAGSFWIDPSPALVRPPAAPADEAFAASLALRNSLQAKLDKLSGARLEKLGPKLRASLTRTRANLAFAPPSATATVRKQDGSIIIELAGQTFARLDGLSGEACFPAALAAQPGVPKAVRIALEQLTGVPEAFELILVEPTKRTILKASLTRPTRVSAPAWVFNADFGPDAHPTASTPSSNQ